MMKSSIRRNHLGWHSNFMGKNGKKKLIYKTPSLCLFWTLRKERNRRSSNDTEQSDQTIKFEFLCTYGLGVYMRITQ